MTKNILTISLAFILTLFTQNLFSQEDEPVLVPKLEKDPEAKAILDKVTQKNKTYETLLIKFTYAYENLEKEEEINTKGLIYTKGEKYKLFLNDTVMEIMYNGHTQASYTRTETSDGEIIEEVTYTIPDKDEDDYISPSKIYSFYEKGFYYRIMGTEELKGKKLTVIDFIPENRKINLSKIRMKIDETKNEIFSVKSFSKNGLRVEIIITEIKPNIKVVDALFNFNEAAHPDAEIIDLRD